MSIIIGAPVHERGWVLRDWFDCLAEQEDVLSQDTEVVLNYGAGNDDTLDVICQEQMNDRFGRVTVLCDSQQDHVKGRRWSLDRYATMTRLRNTLLEYVRERSPDFYLSCDTDMLLPPHTLRTLFENFNGWDGIAPLTFMTTNGENFPNCTTLGGSRFCPKQTGPMATIFGTVLMNERLYSKVDYAVHSMGEDFGWAENAQRQGCSLAICTDVRIKHVMEPDMLSTLDVRIGF